MMFTQYPRYLKICLCKCLFFMVKMYDTGHEVAGKVTLRHIYEIARIKSADPCNENVPMETLCRLIIKSAHTLGIEVVRDLDAEEYGAYLEERRKIVEQQETELQEAKAAKLLRVAV